MDEFRAIAQFSLKDFDLSEDVREALTEHLALILFWEHRLILNYFQQKLGTVRAEIENKIAPVDRYERFGDYAIAAELDRIHREHWRDE